MPSKRIEMIAAEMQKALSDIIQYEVHDPAVPELTSVVHVDVAADLSSAKVHVSTLGEGETLDKAIAALNRGAGFIRLELGRRVDLRHTPKLTFVADKTIRHSAKIQQILENLHHDEPQS